MQYSEKLLDTPVSELTLRELLTFLNRNSDTQESSVRKDEKLVSDDEWICGWRNLAKYLDRSVPTVRAWYRQGKLDKGTRRVGTFFMFNKQWFRNHFM